MEDIFFQYPFLLRYGGFVGFGVDRTPRIPTLPKPVPVDLVYLSCNVIFPAQSSSSHSPGVG